ncbi:MAG: hypothetical protein AVDCRST_MAG06-2423, partial [uncultured Nocardioides sp.]
ATLRRGTAFAGADGTRPRRGGPQVRAHPARHGVRSSLASTGRRGRWCVPRRRRRPDDRRHHRARLGRHRRVPRHAGRCSRCPHLLAGARHRAGRAARDVPRRLRRGRRWPQGQVPHQGTLVRLLHGPHGGALASSARGRLL